MIPRFGAMRFGRGKCKGYLRRNHGTGHGCGSRIFWTLTSFASEFGGFSGVYEEHERNALMGSEQLGRLETGQGGRVLPVLPSSSSLILLGWILAG